jgi:uncharacterized coiled-coil protein SlyX
MLEEKAHSMTFEHRRVEILEGKVKAQKKVIDDLISTSEQQADLINDHKARIEALEKQVKDMRDNLNTFGDLLGIKIPALEKQVLRLSKLVDPAYLFGGKHYQE